MQIKDKIKELRILHRVSQQKLANDIGTTPCLISWWENGKFEPSIYSLIKLADYFGISLDELCCRNYKGGK